MKAFLLAAGVGSRLRPLTDRTPKCLLPIRGTPLLGIWLELCAQASVDVVLINVHAHARAIREYLSTHPVPVEVVLTEEPQLLGSAGTLAINRTWVEGEREFFILYGDVLTNADLRGLLEFHRQARMLATLGLYRVPDPTRCGVVTLNERDIITDFREKPETPASNLVFAGLMVATPGLFRYLPQQHPADIGFHVLPKLSGRMAGFELSEYVKDIGTVQTYREAQETWPGLARKERC